MKRILVVSKANLLVISLWLLAIGAWVWVLAPCELGETPEAQVITIKAVEPNPNPYHRLYEEMLYPVVRIETPEGVGSGVVISHRDTESTENAIYILTAAHVVGNNSQVTVEIYQTVTPLSLSAFVVITDTSKDLALLNVLGPASAGVKPAKLAPRDYVPYLFTPVWVVGCSLGLPPRPSSGHLSALGDSAVDNYWEVSAPILPGNSGGPVFDGRTYEVIGIAVWVKTYHGQLVTTMAGVVPISVVYDFLDEVDKLISR